MMKFDIKDTNVKINKQIVFVFYFQIGIHTKVSNDIFLHNFNPYKNQSIFHQIKSQLVKCSIRVMRQSNFR